MRGMTLWIVGGVVLLAIGIGVYVVTRSDNDGLPIGTEVRTGEQAEIGATKAACELLTDQVAKDVLGSGARKTELPGGGGASTDDVSVTNCLYDNGSDDIKTLRTATLLVRGAKTSSAFEGNRFGFEDTKTSATSGQTPVDITGLGEAAWFNPAIGQVNVLEGDGKYWLIVSAGDGAGKGDRIKSEKLARAVAANL